MSDRRQNVVPLRPPERFTPGFKLCSGCNLQLPLSSFRPRKLVTKTIVYYHCYSCDAASSKRYREANKEKSKQAIKRWMIKNRDRVNASRRRLRRLNPEKTAAENKAYRQTEHGRLVVKMALARYHARLKGANGRYTKAEWVTQLTRQRGRCYYCKRRFTQTLIATQDHLLALSNGGEHAASNIVAACVSCNSSKHNKRTVLI